MEEIETLPKGWKRQVDGLVSPLGKRFANMVAAVEWMIQNKATSDQIRMHRCRSVSSCHLSSETRSSMFRYC